MITPTTSGSGDVLMTGDWKASLRGLYPSDNTVPPTLPYPTLPHPTHSSEREQFIIAKYREKSFANFCDGDKESLNEVTSATYIS